MLKKFSAGAWAACITAVLALVSLIIYGVNVSSEGYFQKASVPNLVLYAVLAIAMLVCSIVLSQIKLNGAAATVVEVATGLMQIAVPVLLALCLINLIAARAEGLGFIYFSNADVALEVQTPANLSSATGSIASMVCFGISMVAGMVAAFFSIRKKNA